MPFESWLTLKSTQVFKIERRITVDMETVRLPDGRLVDDYVQLQMPSFAVSFAETADGKIICIRQYKHGPRRVSLTLPAGHLDGSEDALAAARRELREETGFEGASYSLLGSFAINGNQGCGTGHVVLARGCVRVSDPAPGDLEEMETELLGRDRLRAALFGGEVAIVSHAAAIAMGLLLSR